jgi:hypothetical protein
MADYHHQQVEAPRRPRKWAVSLTSAFKPSRESQLPAMRRSESQDSNDCDKETIKAGLRVWGQRLAAKSIAESDTPSLFLAEALVPSLKSDLIGHPQSPNIATLAPLVGSNRLTTGSTKRSSGLPTSTLSSARIEGQVSVSASSGADMRDLRRACEAALTEALAPCTAGEGVSVAVRPAKDNGTTHGVWMGRKPGGGPLQFGFSVTPNNPHDVEMLREALLFEAACVGAFRLMPCLVAQLSALSLTHLQVVGLNVQPSSLSSSSATSNTR